MDVLRRSGGVAVGIPEHLGHLGGVAAAVLVPGCVVCRGSLVAVFVGVIGYRFIDDLGVVADGGGVGAFGMALIADGCGTACFGGRGDGMCLPFPIHQFRIVFSHGLAFGLIMCILAQSVRISADSGIVFTLIIRTLCHSTRVTNSQITLSIISSRSLIAQVNFYWSWIRTLICTAIRRKGIGRQAEADGQGQRTQPF